MESRPSRGVWKAQKSNPANNGVKSLPVTVAAVENPFDFENTFLYLKRMKTEISFCPTCAGKLDVAEDDQFECEDCETKFYIQIAEEGDSDDEEEEEP